MVAWPVIFSGALFFGVFLFLYGACTCPISMELHEEDLFFSSLPDSLQGKKVLFCGDLHLRRWDYRVVWVQQQIIQSRPDLIIFSGDMVEESGVSCLREFIAPLKASLGKFFTPGNNENHLEDKLHVFDTFESCGFEVLLNRNVRVLDRFVVAGTDDPSRNHDDIDKALKGTQDDDFIIMVTHSPELFPLCREKKIPLTLSGHTHGGQVRLPLIGALWLDIPRADKPYDQGMFDEGGCKLFVTRGVGMSKLPLRTFCNPQVHLFTLTNQA